MYDTHPNEPAPAGFEKLFEARDRIGADELLRRLQLGTTIAFELVFEDGDRRPVAADDWCSEHASTMMKDGRKYHYFSPVISKDPANAREVFAHGQPGRLLLVKLEPSEISASATTKEKGRPPADSWAEVAAAAVAFLHEHGRPEVKADLVKHIQERCRDKIGETSVKAFVSNLFLAIDRIGIK